ncbi:MAG: hypothetical protein IRY97_04830 [Thermomicrobiaceae bacterium]|nr:hypothetical protein [Thermomicrobiaceae bacterium]
MFVERFRGRTVSPVSPRVGGSPLYEPLKRAIDVAVSLAVLGLLSPLWLAIALLIRLTCLL